MNLTNVHFCDLTFGSVDVSSTLFAARMQFHVHILLPHPSPNAKVRHLVELDVCELTHSTGGIEKVHVSKDTRWRQIWAVGLD